MNDLFQLIRQKNNKGYFKEITKYNLNIINEFKQNLLHEAIAFDNEEAAKDLIRRGINVNQQDYNGQTPLHVGAAYSNLAVMTDILETGLADIELKDKFGNSPLWTAVFNARGNYSIVEVLMKYHFDPIHKNSSGLSPLDFAKKIKDTTLISILTSPEGLNQ